MGFVSVPRKRTARFQLPSTKRVYFLPSLLLGLGLVLDLGDTGALLGDALGATLAGGLVADAASLGLVGEDLGAVRLGLGLVDVLHENALVLEDVTLGLHVELVVEVAVDLAGLAVLAQEATEDALPPHPEDLGGHAGLGGTLTLTGTGVATLGLGGLVLAGADARVDDLGLDDDVAVLLEAADVLPRVGVADLGDVGRVEVDLALADAEDGRGEALLGAEVGHGGRSCGAKTGEGASNRRAEF